jgi:hypothetical protein
MASSLKGLANEPLVWERSCLNVDYHSISPCISPAHKNLSMLQDASFAEKREGGLPSIHPLKVGVV